MSLATWWKESLHPRYWHSSGASSLAYLVHIANKFGIEPYELLSSLVEATEKGSTVCGPLTIKTRERTKEDAVFLLEKESVVVAQIRMKNAAWRNPARIRHLYSALINYSHMFRETNEPRRLLLIKELRPGMKNICLRQNH